MVSESDYFLQALVNSQAKSEDFFYLLRCFKKYWLMAILMLVVVMKL